MGLDKQFEKCLNNFVTLKLLLARLGTQKKRRVSPLVEERKRFEREVREQLLKLKEKGISLPVMTL